MLGKNNNNNKIKIVCFFDIEPMTKKGNFKTGIERLMILQISFLLAGGQAL